MILICMTVGKVKRWFLASPYHNTFNIMTKGLDDLIVEPTQNVAIAVLPPISNNFA